MITLDDLKTRFGSDELIALSDRQGRDVIDVKVINKAISDATAEVASYLLPTGLVKFNDTGVVYVGSVMPKALTIKTCDIARYYLHDDNLTETVEKRYKQAIDWLKLVQKNPAMLTGVNDNNGDNQNVNSGIYVMPNPKPNEWID